MIEDSQRRTPPRPEAGAVRFMRDETGRQWAVRETGPSTYDRRGRRSLVFDADGIMRRVHNYPPDWYNWSDADLLALSERA